MRRSTAERYIIAEPLPTDTRMQEPNEPRRPVAAPPERGGPYFGRLLVVLLVAVGFCAFMTWLLSTTMAH